MGEWIRSGLDIILVIMVGIGLYQAMRLINQLRTLRQSRVEMQHFVQEFNATVIRAEAGIKGLRAAARDSGDDLEKMVEKALYLRDELQFLVESGNGIAERISQSASKAVRIDPKPEATKPAAPANTQPAVKPAAAPPETKEAAAPSSRAEKELLQALQKLS